MDFLTKFLNGENRAVGESFEYCEEDCNAIDECGLPLSTLIESVFTDMQMGLIAAEETYELACIVGGTQVITEGSGQEGATLVLEGAIKNFFGMIAKKLKQFWEWIKKMWNKFIGLFKKDGKALNSEFDKVKPAVEKKIEETKNLPAVVNAKGGAPATVNSGKGGVPATTNSGNGEKNLPAVAGGGKGGVPMIPESLVILDPEKGEDTVLKTGKKINEAVNDIIEELGNFVKSNNSLPDKSYSGNDSTAANSDAVDAMSQDAFEEVMFKGLIGPSVKNNEDFLNAIRAAYGADNKPTSATRLTDKELTAMEKIIRLADDKSMKEYNDGANLINKACQDAIKLCEELSKGADGSNVSVKKSMQQISRTLTWLGKELVAMVNTRTSIILNGARSYVSYLKSVAGSAVQDSVDYSVYFESRDVVSEECKPTDEGCDSEDDDEPCEDSYNFENYSGLASFMSV